MGNRGQRAGLRRWPGGIPFRCATDRRSTRPINGARCWTCRSCSKTIAVRRTQSFTWQRRRGRTPGAPSPPQSRLEYHHHPRPRHLRQHLLAQLDCYPALDRRQLPGLNARTRRRSDGRSDSFVFPLTRGRCGEARRGTCGFGSLRSAGSRIACTVDGLARG